MAIILSNLNRFAFFFTGRLPHYLVKEGGCLVDFYRLLAVWWPGAQSARDNHLIACNFAKYSLILFFFTDRLTNKPFLIWLLTTPPDFKYVPILPCNLSLIACFLAFFNVSQGSVATYARS